MCGICGIVDLSKQGRADPELVRRMSALIQHRGPDGDGFYNAAQVSLGMRRLSIIDVDGSDQPLFNEDHSIALVFNGEIYNYKELRADLLKGGHHLSTEGDGETIIHLYEDCGLDLFAHLRGMYAFALWDAKAERLVLAVDHIGMKPLYLHERDGKLLFASEIKAFFADSETPRRMNLDVLDTFLSVGYMVGEETLFEGMRRLPPGHALVAENGSTRLHPYWAFGGGYSSHNGRGDLLGRPYSEHNEREASIITTARDLIADSVRIHLRSDVPLGLFLSGGIDSAAVLALMSREAGGRVKTYTVGYDADVPDNELLHARRIAGHFASDHYERIINADDWWQGFEKYVYHHDEPNANPSAISMLLLAEETAKHVKVVLTGLGGDELFAGYPSHRAIPQLLRRHAVWGRWIAPLSKPLGALENYFPMLKRYRIIGALPTYLPRIRHALMSPHEGIARSMHFDGMIFSDGLRQQLYGGDLMQAWQKTHHRESTFADIIRRSWRDDPYNTAQALTINTWLTGNALLSQDKVTMASSLEARVPFFDPVLFDFAAKVPPAVRMKSNKYVLREAMRGCVPDFALQRPKQPFGTPILFWFDHNLQSRIQEVLLDTGAHIRPLFNRPALEKLLRAHFSGRERYEEVVFRLLNLELWQRRFIHEEVIAR
jgi:asparagine synthase (glutamine-hydrolysing)